MKTKIAFCANCQTEKEHEATIDQNGEYLFTCDCGRFFKLPADLTKKEIADTLGAHEIANQGQITIEEIEAENEIKLENI